MPRRFIMGGDGSGGFVIRQSKPGYDVMTAGPDGLIFDSDYIPGRILGQNGGVLAPTPGTLGNAGLNSLPHGLGVWPSMMYAMAKQITSPTDGTDYPWTYQQYAPNGSGGQTWSEGGMQNANLTNRFASAFNYAQTTYSPTTGYSGGAWGGWWYYWDGSYIHVQNRTARPLVVAWIAFQL